ncbi:SDR family oxidoreductase [Marinilabiliaceae bacterium JC017]|nr:SDR family oxidoreductase [Marinilabiliaceae bacterium JC017]
MKIAITAASGQLGNAIIKEALQHTDADNVIAIARSPERVSFPDLEVRKGDYNNEGEFQEALSGVDTLLLVSGMDKPEKRVQQHRNVIEAAQRSGVQKLVYTSIFGEAGKCAFDSIILANRKTEQDIRESGLDWSIGRNGLYLDADLDYLDYYFKAGKIINCADNGRCGYTTREELAFAYWKLLSEAKHNQKTYNLTGESITQYELTAMINEVFGTSLIYEPIGVEVYKQDRKAVHGAFFGGIIAGIYEGIRNGAFDVESDFYAVTGRMHLPVREVIKAYKEMTGKN